MPTLVHLADERELASIKNSGIKIGKHRRGIYCMPVLQNFYVSHQWLRELKRGGAKTLIGVYFKISSRELVYAGKFNQEHKHISLGEAIKEIMRLEDPLGYELIMDRKIEPREITKIKSLPQKLGWRYFPNSHNKRPTCACPVCIRIGSIKGKRLRERIEPPVKAMGYNTIILKLQTSKKEDEIEELLQLIAEKRRRADPFKLIFLLDKNSNTINQAMAITLSVFRHKNAKHLLLRLLLSDDEETIELSTESLLKLYGKEMEISLLERKDPVITQKIYEWKKSKSPINI